MYAARFSVALLYPLKLPAREPAGVQRRMIYFSVIGTERLTVDGTSHIVSAITCTV